MDTFEIVDHDLVAVEEFDALPFATKHDIHLTMGREAWLFELQIAEETKEHAKKVAQQLGVDHGIIYLPGQLEQAWEDSDMEAPFRQRRYFYYMSGADFSGCAVTYDIEADNLILWVPYTAPQAILWYGTTPTPAECLEASDLDDVKYIAELPKYLVPTLALVETLYVLRESQLPRFKSFETLRPHVKIDTTSLISAIGEARVVKTDYEIAAIRKANNISSAAHRAVCQKLLSLRNECEVEAIFQAVSIAHNAHSQSYAIIAGSGANAASLHYGANNEPLKGRQLLVLDAGAEWKVYASDITRTLPIQGKFTAEARAIYDLVTEMQTQCIERIRPGTVYYSLHLHAHMVAVKGLLELGILHNGTASEIFKNGTSTAFFPHGLGHHVGLEVHDVPGYERLMLEVDGFLALGGKKRPVVPEMLRDMMVMDLEISSGRQDTAGPPYRGRRELAPGMIVTVEPGIYFCKPYIEAYFLKQPEHAKYINTEVLDRYWDVGGVRIEDDILVTRDGNENLSWAPKGEEMLKIINGKSK
ncbi:putative Xaa-Pro aminopeptidase [Seiridium cardinale]|uniref:Xaa-Pro aminopeptidase n=1 Tax=Seiridium cardinale TaxID=138064 RepID=A0ABR2XPG2_9PEZI